MSNVRRNMSEGDFASLVERLAEPVARQVMRVADQRRPNQDLFQNTHDEVRHVFRLADRGRRGGNQRRSGYRGNNRNQGQMRLHPYRPPVSTGKAIDVILLPSPHCSSSIRGDARARLHERGCIMDKYFIKRSWSPSEVMAKLFQAFEDQLNDGAPISFQILKPEGQNLVTPRLAPGDELCGSRVCDIFCQKTMYLRPERDISEATDDEEVDMPNPYISRRYTSSSPASYCSESGSQFGPSTSTALPVLPSSTSQKTACPQCTYLNTQSASNCDMCEADLELIPPPSTASDDHKHGCKNPTEIIQRFVSLINFENKPHITLNVNRDTVFSDNVAFFKNCKFDAKSGPTRVHFVGEEGIDAGGLLRENFRLFMEEVKSPTQNLLLATSSGKLLPSNNQFHVFSGMYTVLGKAIGTALLNSVPVELPLHNAVIALVLKKSLETVYQEMDKSDIIDVNLQEFITKLMDETDEKKFEDLVLKEERATHWLDSCGWPATQAMTLAKKHDLALCLIFHFIIGIRRDAIDAIQTGLFECIPDLHQADLEAFSKLLACQPIVATKLRDMVQEPLQELRNGSRSLAYQRTVTFISRFFADLDDTEANVVAVFATGSSCLSDMTLKVSVNSLRPAERSPIANTCDCSILFPQGHTNYASFKSTVLNRMRQTGSYFGIF